MQFLFDYNDYFEVVTTLVQTFIIGLVIFSFLKIMFSPIMKVLRENTKKKNFSVLNALRLLIIAKSNPTRIIRAFCEYIIFLDTEAEDFNWKKILNNFRSEIYHNNKIIISDVSLLKDPYYQQQINKYFGSVNKHLANELLPEELMSFVLKMQIDKCYLAPLVRISSMATDDISWAKIVSSFSNEFTNNNIINSKELTNTYTWLLWGTSIEGTNSSDHYNLFQLGQGDEENSIDTVLKNDVKSKELFEQITLNSKNKTFGKTVNVTCTLYQGHKYFKRNKGEFALFEKKYIDEFMETDRQVVIEIEDFNIPSDQHSKNYLYTAYIWIAFYKTNKESKQFSPSNMISFFEHCNISNNEHYSFLEKQLVNKALSYFENLEKDHTDSTYHLVGSINKSVEKQFLKSLKEVPHCKINVDGPRLNTNVEYLKKINNHFDKVLKSKQIDGPEVELIHINIHEDAEKRSEHLALLGSYYTQNYIEAFPLVDERESLDNIIESLKDTRQLNEAQYLVTIARYENEIVGGLIYNYLPMANLGFVEFISVSPKFKGKNIAQSLMNSAFQKLQEEAKARGLPRPLGILGEADFREPHTKTSKINFFKKMNVQLLKYDYVQPALEQGKQALDYLRMIFIPAVETQNLSSESIQKALYQMFKHCFYFENPADSVEYNQMILKLQKSEKTEFENLDTLFTEVKKKEAA